MKYNLYFHCSENTAFYIFMAVKYSFFFKYALYLINIFLYFITLYIINTNLTLNEWNIFKSSNDNAIYTTTKMNDSGVYKFHTE